MGILVLKFYLKHLLSYFEQIKVILQTPSKFAKQLYTNFSYAFPKQKLYVLPVGVLVGQEQAAFGQLLQELLLLLLGGVQRDVEQDQLSRPLHVKLVRELLVEVFEHRSKLLALLTLAGAEEQHEDAVLEPQDDLTLRVQLVSVFIVLQQNLPQEQVHHDSF